ncbi:translation initiation factor IF-2-like [Vidua chalybeata]|uniref:translation initiation factor IF-2-like n=1 Tax=Vidua chalybeata TaxID=81927 RepID=UPI0023A7E454|nr:translation initiation factor IF-2-like [Vidua chalybeata]
MLSFSSVITPKSFSSSFSFSGTGLTWGGVGATTPRVGQGLEPRRWRSAGLPRRAAHAGGQAPPPAEAKDQPQRALPARAAAAPVPPPAVSRGGAAARGGASAIPGPRRGEVAAADPGPAEAEGAGGRGPDSAGRAMLVSAGRPRRCVAARPGPAWPGPAGREGGGAGPGSESRRGERGKGRSGPARPPAFLLPGALPARERGGGGGGRPARSWIRPRAGPERGGRELRSQNASPPSGCGSAPLAAPAPQDLLDRRGAARSLPPSPAFPRDRGPCMARAPRWLPQPFRPAPAALRPRACPPAALAVPPSAPGLPTPAIPGPSPPTTLPSFLPVACNRISSLEELLITEEKVTCGIFLLIFDTHKDVC